VRQAIYLDFNATAPGKPAVREAVAAALDIGGNPSSVHGFGRRARQAVEEARERVAALVGADPGGVIFTGSGSEANNLVLSSFEPRILASAVEHDSVLARVAEPDRLRWIQPG
jgi:cysteine desulfurase